LGSEPSTTQLLSDVRNGNRGAFDALWPRIYDELRTLAHNRLRRERGRTLNTTALVHEAYIKLTAGDTPAVNDRSHFMALASRAMRFVLVGYARQRTAGKRGGKEDDLSLDESIAVVTRLESEEQATVNLLALDMALDTLAKRSERLAKLVEYRFFGGLTNEEIAVVTESSVSTVIRDWRRARVYLYQAMQDPEDESI
jgi:RNA polymerase sigma factor (TIGR02999 family)